eukprot:1302310-Alexandrium_andersonii.AAC.1
MQAVCCGRFFAAAGAPRRAAPCQPTGASSCSPPCGKGPHSGGAGQPGAGGQAGGPAAVGGAAQASA